MFELITTYYRSSESEREEENMQCLIKNLDHPLIDKVHLFLQSSDRPNLSKHDKLHFVEHYKRPTFSELFVYGNSLGGNVIKIIANSDIYFDNSLQLSIKALKKWDILALTRWDLKENGSLDFYNNFKSQDVWIFSKHIEKGIGDFHIGRHGCDNRLAFQFKKYGYRISNPSFTIKIIHLHQSALRTYFNDPNYEYVQPPYEYLLPISIDSNKDPQIRLNYYDSRYRYFRSLSNNSLPGVKHSSFNKLISFILSKYFAFKINTIG